MIDIAARIRAAALEGSPLRARAAELWKRSAPPLFDEHEERTGLRVSDAGRCVRQVWDEIHNGKQPRDPDVQIDSLDDGTLIGCWRACLLAASLKADGYHVELEPEVSHDGTPGHIDLFYQRITSPSLVEDGVVEFKYTKQSWSVKAPDEPNKNGDTKRFQILQLMKYCAAKGCEDGAIVTIAPSWEGKGRVDWYKLGDWQHAVIGEWLRLSAALGPVEPEGDAAEKWRCRASSCSVSACPRNENYAEPLEEKLAASLAARETALNELSAITSAPSFAKELEKLK
jgi:hypothetical protein